MFKPSFGEERYCGNGITSGAYIIYLFCYNVIGTRSFYGKQWIYEIHFSLGGEVIRSFYPVYRKSDSKPGMYDIVNGVFYTNQGTGEFLVGPNK